MDGVLFEPTDGLILWDTRWAGAQDLEPPHHQVIEEPRGPLWAVCVGEAPL